VSKANMDEIYRQNADIVYRYLFSLSQDAHLAEELTQQTFCEAIHAVGRYRGDASLSTFLCGIAKKLLQKELLRRSANQTVPLDETPVPDSADTESAVLDSDEKLEFFRKIHDLPQNSREVVYLRLSGELSFKEIGEILDRSETWARVTFYRAKQTLMKGDGK
jgi:RNA polymerase sigma factor (sigma-70 family)